MRAESAVHSAKDLPSVTPDGLCSRAFRGVRDPRDAMVGADRSTISAPGADGRDRISAESGAARLAQAGPDLLRAAREHRTRASSGRRRSEPGSDGDGGARDGSGSPGA